MCDADAAVQEEACKEAQAGLQADMCLVIESANSRSVPMADPYGSSNSISMPGQVHTFTVAWPRSIGLLGMATSQLCIW